MDVENYLTLGISEEFAANQRRVLAAFEEMSVVTTCSCTPYLFGNLPRFGEHIAWAESSAVLLRELRPRRTHQPGRRSLRSCCCPHRTNPGLWLPSR